MAKGWDSSHEYHPNGEWEAGGLGHVSGRVRRRFFKKGRDGCRVFGADWSPARALTM